jgi:FkbM family methyltransferase
MIKKKIEGTPMWLNPNDRGISNALIRHGFREAAFMWILRHEASGVALDIGANIGYCTLSLAERCKQVVAYEPDPRSLKILKKNIKLNRLENVIVFQRAITPWSGKVSVTLADKPNLSSTCIIPENLPTKGQGVFVDSDKLSSWIPEVNFVKMDIEGEEARVLGEAAEELCKRNVKLLVEVHPKDYEKNNLDMVTPLTKLVDGGYKFKYLINAKDKKDIIKAKYPVFKICKKYSKRVIFKNIKPEDAIPWCTEMPADGKKVARSFLLYKEGA